MVLTKTKAEKVFMEVQKFNREDIRYPLGDNKEENRQLWDTWKADLLRRGIIDSRQFNQWCYPHNVYFY